MNSVGIFQSNLGPNFVGQVKAEPSKQVAASTNVGMTNPVAAKQPSFKAAIQQPVSIRTELTTNEEKQKYTQLFESLDKQNRKNLELLLKTGKLLNANSNDKSSTLDNLQKILTNPRAKGLTPETVLRETVATLADPFIITQQFGDIPKNEIGAVLALGKQNNQNSTNIIKNTTNPKSDVLNEKTINVERSGACVAASIEFNLAKQSPAEFARFAESLSSPKVSVEKIIGSKNLANNTLDTVWLLNAFEVPYKMDNFDNAKLTLAPDKNAIIRARIQNAYKDAGERSVVDVLMQSTFMNVGSQQSYNSLTDVRHGKFNQNDKGLIEFEKTFTESVVEDKNKISMTYQIVDDNAKLVGYETDFNTMKKHILDSLAIGENVIIGYTQVDKNNTIINGHEITIVAARQDKNGKLIFTCNDTDDNNSKPIEYNEDYLIPKIHHAGLPAQVVENDVKVLDNWVDGLNAYQQAKKQIKQKSA